MRDAVTDFGTPASQLCSLLRSRSNVEPIVGDVPEYICREAFICRLDNVFDGDECSALMALAAEAGYEPALVNVGGGKQMLATDVRRSSRCIIDSSELADIIWERIIAYVPERWPPREYGTTEPSSQQVMGLNERLRFLMYHVGDFFGQHTDGCYVRENGDASHITLLLYLNDDYRGGCTTMYNTSGRAFEVQPKPGTIVIHDHRILHESPPLVEGTKHVIRTDIMYSEPEPPAFNFANRVDR